MSSVNYCHVMGHVGRKPESRSTASGNMVCNFSVATSESSGEGDSKKENTTWHNIVAFGKTAEICNKYVDKGKQVFIEGRMQTRSWDDKTTGEKKYRSEIVARRIVLLGAKTAGDTALADDSDGVPF